MTETAELVKIDEDGHPFGEVAKSGPTAMDIATSRAAQEVQASMVIAKRFPRDQASAYGRIIQACQRKGLAEKAMYAYKRGGTIITGPSIRLAEAILQAWGNADAGVIELEQRNGRSTVMAYASDLETNTRTTRVFEVKHERTTKGGSYALTDPRDIYELTANQGARRLRACILAIIPGDITEAAVRECEKTLSGNGKEPLADRARKMLAAFAELGVTKEMIEGRLQHPITAIAEAELGTLRAIYTSLHDGVSKREEWFGLPGVAGASDLDSLSEEIEKKKAPGKADPVISPALKKFVEAREILAAEHEAIVNEKLDDDARREIGFDFLTLILGAEGGQKARDAILKGDTAAVDADLQKVAGAMSSQTLKLRNKREKEKAEGGQKQL